MDTTQYPVPLNAIVAMSFVAEHLITVGVLFDEPLAQDQHLSLD